MFRPRPVKPRWTKSPGWRSCRRLRPEPFIVKTTYTVPDGIRQLRADKALSLSHPDHSRVAFRRAFDAGLVTLRGKVIVPDTPVAGGDTLEFSFPDLKPAELKAVDIPLDVIFEDKHLLAINKTAGMIVHPGAGHGGGHAGPRASGTLQGRAQRHRRRGASGHRAPARSRDLRHHSRSQNRQGASGTGRAISGAGVAKGISALVAVRPS